MVAVRITDFAVREIESLRKKAKPEGDIGFDADIGQVEQVAKPVEDQGKSSRKSEGDVMVQAEGEFREQRRRCYRESPSPPEVIGIAASNAQKSSTVSGSWEINCHNSETTGMWIVALAMSRMSSRIWTSIVMKLSTTASTKSRRVLAISLAELIRSAIPSPRTYWDWRSSV